MKYRVILYFIVTLNLNINAQNWQQFGNGILSGNMFYLDIVANRLYAYGRFINQNNDTVISPAYWDGSNWKTLGNFDFTNSGNVDCIQLFDSTLYVGGDFLKALGAPGNYILKLQEGKNMGSFARRQPFFTLQLLIGKL